MHESTLEGTCLFFCLLQMRVFRSWYFQHAQVYFKACYLLRFRSLFDCALQSLQKDFLLLLLPCANDVYLGKAVRTDGRAILCCSVGIVFCYCCCRGAMLTEQLARMRAIKQQRMDDEEVCSLRRRAAQTRKEISRRQVAAVGHSWEWTYYHEGACSRSPLLDADDSWFSEARRRLHHVRVRRRWRRRC